MRAEDVVGLQALVDELGIPWWIIGGWGVDALLGAESRTHGDLDVLILRDDLATFRRALAACGYELAHTWEESQSLPGLDDRDGDVPGATAFVLADGEGRKVDVHVVDVGVGGACVPLWHTDLIFTADDLAASGTVGGRSVPCMSAAMQLRCHVGYELPEAHRADVARLRDHLATSGPTGSMPSPVSSAQDRQGAEASVGRL